MMASVDQAAMIKIVVKTPQIKETIEINEKAKIQELRKLASERFNAETERLTLIFAGKILKDNDTLEQHKITDGLTIHLVIRPIKKPESQSNTNENANTSTTPSTTPSNTTSSTNTTSTSNSNQNPFNLMGSLGDMSFGRNILNNPEITQQIFNNPLIQDFMSNPDNIRAMLSMNPQMQQLIERNPEINHLLNNNEIIRNSMEMIRNPSAFQELMRQQDRALSNLESLPGGYNALRRMYTELQEPMLNAASEQLTGENPFASFARQNNSSDNTGSTNVQAGTENVEPLPNPWVSTNAPSTGNRTDSSVNTQASTAGNRGTFNSNLFSQFIDNPDLMNTMLNSPQTQQLMQSLSSNPELMLQIMSNNPLLNSDPNLRQQMHSLLPNAFQQLQSPELRQAFTNPEVLNAMMQITNGIETLQRISPDLFNVLISGRSGVRAGVPTTVSSNNTPPTANATINTSSTNTTNQSPNVNSISQLMSQMFAGGLSTPAATAPAANAQQPPEERYRNQLEQLNSMGFIDREQNLNALIETFGDLNGAIERLLNRNQSYFS